MARIDLSALEPEVRDLLPTFLAGSRGRLDSLNQLLSERRFEEIRRLGHGLKGTSAMYQLPELADLGRELERAAVAADEPAIVECGRQWRESLEILATILT